MTATTAERYANGQKRKVYQRATCIVVMEVPDTTGWPTVRDNIKATGRFKANLKTNWCPRKHRTLIMTVSYEAVGANRADIAKYMERVYGDAVQHVSTAEVEVLGG